jgi:hypothetical protein
MVVAQPEQFLLAAAGIVATLTQAHASQRYSYSVPRLNPVTLSLFPQCNRSAWVKGDPEKIALS